MQKKMKWVTWLWVGLGVVVAVRLGAGVVKLYKAGEKVKSAERELAEAKAKNGELQQELRYVQSEEFVEKEARNKLGLGKEGEVTLILPKAEDTKTETESSRQGGPVWRQWYDLYVGR